MIVIIVITATLAIFLSTPLAIFLSTPPQAPQDEYVSHSTIKIDNDSDLNAQNGVSGGSGTTADPFIIERLSINASQKDGLKIGNMSKYVVIRNISVHDGGVNYNGITLWNCSNIRVYNSTCWNNLNGMNIWSSKVQISGNNCSNNNQSGILMVGDNLTISDNSIDSNGWAGINCESCRDSEIERNSLSDNPRGINCHDLWECVISNNSIFGHDSSIIFFDGINIACSHHVLVANNTVINVLGTIATQGYGISIVRALGGGDNITVEGNYVSAWYGGIWCSNIQDGIIRFNLIRDNSKGMSLMWAREIYGNSFINNTLQAETVYAYAYIFFNASYPIGGNYWSNYSGADLKSGELQNISGGDGIGDTPQPVNNGNKDCYPLMSPSPYSRIA